MVHHVCPWWVGYLLLNPLRKLKQNPEKILSPYIDQGTTVLDYGSAMGFFSLPMAKIVGENGKVICVDIQIKMLEKLKKRAKKKKLLDSIDLRLASRGSFGLDNLGSQVDFALLFAVVHEVPDKEGLFQGLYEILKKDSKLLFAEPKGRVKETEFQDSIRIAEKAGFKVIDLPEIGRSLAVLLQKKVR